MKNGVIGYSLVLAGAIVATTVIAANMQASFAASMLAPVLMSLTIVTVGAHCERRVGGMLRPALLLGGALAVACAIVALKKPTSVAAMLPTLAAAVVTPIIIRLSRGDIDGSGSAGDR